MDCEKFEPLLLDELYEELDELTSAAVKRHVSGCARCKGILGGLRATRRGLALPLVPVPAALEDRIFAAATEARKRVPMKSRMSRALSVAGTWAMRPQTAMAAVFLLMIGTSAFLVRSKDYASKESTVSVTVQGSPTPTARSAESESIDDKAAAAAHGPSTPPNIAHPPAQSLASASALNDESSQLVERVTGGMARDKGGAAEGALGSTLGEAKALDSTGSSRPRPAASSTATSPSPAAVAMEGDSDGSYAQLTTKATSPTKRAGQAEQPAETPFSLGAAAFRARNFAEAAHQFDLAARSGDLNAELWAAESVREGQGCHVAVGRFEQLSRRATGSWVGSEASLRAARCQIAMGQLDLARDRLSALAHVPSHQQAAQQAMSELQVAARKAAGGGATSGGGLAAPKRATAPARPAAPARAPADAQQEKKATDSTSLGF